ncbi:hypothetical protein PXK58_01955 [Phaeobacter gallaeciensis]|uniref:hypothetical protein n=1 Tax=Phaeobacter gallaeciensis TaxID=60890 RepID=UPI00238089E4|nr:hypothetical protein [Phaeobacter gallaeciensis]MDE4272746.1 hypothetical protein [Phaeobacter gallaeciensis]MDE4298301.1 hypothetical protein [Phaeobacter gallaeciensis]MDE5183489.1 hypothetical protein [Phaeobacter gallaeciensis]
MNAVEIDEVVSELTDAPFGVFLISALGVLANSKGRAKIGYRPGQVRNLTRGERNARPIAHLFKTLQLGHT